MELTVNQLIDELVKHRDEHGRGDYQVVVGIVGRPGTGTASVVSGLPDTCGEVVQVLGVAR